MPILPVAWVPLVIFSRFVFSPHVNCACFSCGLLFTSVNAYGSLFFSVKINNKKNLEYQIVESNSQSEHSSTGLGLYS